METVLEIDDLHVSYFVQRGEVKAVDGVTFRINKSEIFGLAGESGCGKSTLAYSILRLVKPPGKIMGGGIRVDGTDILKLNKEELRSYRWKKMAMIFQGAMSSLNPTHRVCSQIAEALLVHERIGKEEALDRAKELLFSVGVDKSKAKDYPFQLSGGMRQRAVIAMAIALNPPLLIADEPTTALDVLTERKILVLLKNLQKKFKFSILMITHNLNMLANFCDKIAIMYAGRIVEIAPAKRLISHPLHPYSRGLLKSRIDPIHKKFWSIGGSPPDLVNPPHGCRFHPRCQIATDICKKETPQLREIKHNQYVSCHEV